MHHLTGQKEIITGVVRCDGRGHHCPTYKHVKKSSGRAHGFAPLFLSQRRLLILNPKTCIHLIKKTKYFAKDNTLERYLIWNKFFVVFPSSGKTLFGSYLSVSVIQHVFRNCIRDLVFCMLISEYLQWHTTNHKFFPKILYYF